MNPAVIIPRKGINDEGLGKKHALSRLIAQADSEWVWLMDDDVLPAPALGTLPSACSDHDLLILPLRMQTIGNTLLERLQQAEYAAIQQLTISSAIRGKAVMCSGANLLVRRQCWLDSYADLHPEIASGDDMFLLESFKRRGLRIGVVDDPQYTATITALQSWSDFWHQRMRWAGKAPHYTDSDIRRCGAIVLVANILQVVCPPFLLIKFPVEYHIIKKRDRSISLLIAFLLELLYPFYGLICLVGGLFRREW